VDDEVFAVVGDSAVEAPVLVVGAVVDEEVVRLRRAQGVVVELVEVVGLGELLGLGGGVVAAVEEPFAVLGPGDAGELDPLDVVGEVLGGGDVADADLLPVGAGDGEGVGEAVAVVGDVEAGEGDRAVFRKRVGVEKEGGLVGEVGGGVEDGLVLQAVVAGEEVAVGALEGDAVALVVPELGQAGLDLGPLGDGVEVGEGDLVLGLDQALVSAELSSSSQR